MLVSYHFLICNFCIILYFESKLQDIEKICKLIFAHKTAALFEIETLVILWIKWTIGVIYCSNLLRQIKCVNNKFQQ